MQFRKLRNGLELSEVGLGAAQLGNMHRVTSDDEAEETLEAAWSGGIRYFDTAPHYGLGLSERRLADGLRSRSRSQFVMSTKVGRVLEPSPESAHLVDDDLFHVRQTFKRRWDFSRDGVFRSVEDSLRRTGLEYFDVVFLHDPDDHFEQATTEGIDALIEMRDQGMVSAVGAGMNSAGPLVELIRRADIDVVLCAGRYTLLDASAGEELLPLASARGVGVVAAGIFNSGILGAPRPTTAARFEYQTAPADALSRARAIADFGRGYGMTLPEIAIAFALRHPAIVSVVLGARGRLQVAQNLERAAGQVPDALWAELTDAGLIAP